MLLQKQKNLNVYEENIRTDVLKNGIVLTLRAMDVLW